MILYWLLILKKYLLDTFICFLLSEAKYKIKYVEELKILTPKQMLKRLPIALAQVR